MFFVEPIAGAVVGKIWDERRLIAAYAKDFYQMITKGQLKLLVFGAAGTGKTTFGKILDGQEDIGQISGTYSLSSETEFYGIEDKHFVTISVPPGQSAFRPRHWAQLYKVLQNSKRSIVVNVVSWGFHSVERQDLNGIDEFKNGVSEETKAMFLHNRRQTEMRTLGEIVQPLSNYQPHLHMITLVTKQDLWWKDRSSTRGFYERPDGVYLNTLQGIYEAKGKANFTHHFRSVSFGQINFKTADGHILFETAAGYDNGILGANFDNFMNLLRQIAQ
jgi:hypothetical protein